MATIESKIDKHSVSDIDLKKYMGKWYEIARYDHSFEHEMTDVSAEYSFKPNGEIEVINSGLKNGRVKRIKGRLRKKKNSEPGCFEVSFFLWFYSGYIVMELDKENYSYAVIGSDADKYLWILSRTKTLEKDLLDQILDKISHRGYDITKLLYVAQNEDL